MLATLAVVSLVITAFTAYFILRGIKEAKIKEEEKQTAIQAEQKRQAATQEEQEKQAANEVEEKEQEDLTAIEAEEKEQEGLATIEAEKAEKDAALKAALEAPRPWQLKTSIKSNSSDLESVLRGEKK